MTSTRLAGFTAFFLVGAALSCDRGGAKATTSAAAPSASSEVAAEDGHAHGLTVPKPAPAATRVGSSVTFFRGGIVLADEPNQALVVLSDAGSVERRLPMPGRPASLLSLDDKLYVTIRDASEGGLLVELGGASDIHELRRVALADDAFGLSSSNDGGTFVVTSAWTHRVTGIDAATMTKRWELDVGREPRGVVVSDSGTAWVSHLVGTVIDRIDGATGATPKRKLVDLPAAPLRSKDDATASLGWALALSDDGARLFAPRHALGAFGRDAWFGVATVDVLLTAGDAPLVPRARAPVTLAAAGAPKDDRLGGERGTVALGELAPFTQPRAVLYQKGTESLFVLGEGDARLVELDADALDPSLVVRAKVDLGDGCFGPSGMVLGANEIVVQCAASFTWVRVPLPLGSHRGALRTYGADPLPDPAAEGRRMFVDARERLVSGGLGCAGCHPEGRDDGHVWHEIDTSKSGIETPFDVAPQVFVSGVHVAQTDGFARRTPMLAGRLESPGPYGWKAQAKTLEDRITEGTKLHRWHQPPFDEDRAKALVKSIALYVREGLVAPRGFGRALTAEEQLGKTIYERGDTGCTNCHSGDASSHVLSPWHTRAGFADETTAFRTPNLHYVSHTAPYFHDGSAPTLEALIDDNDDRMGRTNQLDPRERKALVAYLRTL